jgi:hypothetical protein
MLDENTLAYITAELLSKKFCRNIDILANPVESPRVNLIKVFWSIYHIMILVYFTVGSTSSGSAFVIAPNLGAKILSEYFTGSAPPLLCS